MGVVYRSIYKAHFGQLGRNLNIGINGPINRAVESCPGDKRCSCSILGYREDIDILDNFVGGILRGDNIACRNKHPSSALFDVICFVSFFRIAESIYRFILSGGGIESEQLIVVYSKLEIFRIGGVGPSSGDCHLGQL